MKKIESIEEENDDEFYLNEIKENDENQNDKTNKSIKLTRKKLSQIRVKAGIIKFKETDDDLVKKTMKRELRMLQQLRHPNIVDFREAFKRKGNLFLVFEFVDRDLLQLLQSNPNGLNPDLIRHLMYQLCKAISYLHSQDVIHRDIKP